MFGDPARRTHRAEAHLIVGALRAPSVVALGTLKIHTADDSSALEAAEIAKIMPQARAPVVRHHAQWYLGLLALSQGDPMRAHGWLCFGGHVERLSMFPLYPHEVAYDAERVRIAAAVGDEELTAYAISIAERRASLNPDVPPCDAAAAHARGIAALDEALTIAARVGAGWDAARVRGRLRRLGVRRRPSKVDRPKTGWDALTETESVIVNLAAHGRINQEIADKLFISVAAGCWLALMP